jgi:alpha-beta hydrolase superfamily lysophospholipase
VSAEVTRKFPEDERVPSNRYYADSPVYPPRLQRDWNRSYVLDPDGTPLGAVVLLHGLTDSPYSLRHIARRYRERGFVAIAIRLPGHGTVPAGLSDVIGRMGGGDRARGLVRLREPRQAAARRRLLERRPLAMKHSLDALADPTLPRADRLVLISPMIGITSFARFAGFFGWPAVFPAFANAAWLAVVPEFNPFKYNSFPINGARQSSLLTRVLQDQIADYARSGKLADVPPVLTFQSVVDFTVSTRAIVTSLYAHLPANGSELVLFDLNRSAAFGALIRASANTVLNRILPDPPRAYRTTIVTNADPQHEDVVARTIEAGARDGRAPLPGLTYPRDVFSLSHVAIPFPMDDSLYGLQPNLDDDYGVNLGAMALRGETGTLIVSLDSLIRMSANPFFPFMLSRIEDGIGRPAGQAATAPK